MTSHPFVPPRRLGLALATPLLVAACTPAHQGPRFNPIPARGESVAVQPGHLVRLTPVASGRPLDAVFGTFVAWSGDSIVLRRDSRNDTVRLALAGFRADVSTGRINRVRTLGLLGAFVGGVAGAAAWEPCEPQGLFSCIYEPSQAEYFASGALLGALAGGIAGMALSGHHWRPLRPGHETPMVQPRVSLSRDAREVRIGLQLRL